MHFKIYTGHFGFKYMLEQQISTPLQQKWLIKLIGYDFEIIYRSGKENKAADALSRLHEPLGSSTLMRISSPIATWVEQLKQEWQQDQAIQNLIQEIQLNPTSHPKFSWENNLLECKGSLWVGFDSH